jgi:pilus assembly protein CpaF
MMKREILRYIEQTGLCAAGMNQAQFFQKLQEEILYYGPIQRALDDPAVTNIDVNSYQYVYIERNGEEEFHPEMAFSDEAHLEVILNKMLMADGKVLTANEPHIDSLFEQFRICAVLGAGRGGIATEGTCASIRKFSEETITPAHLVAGGSISSEMDAFFSQVLPWCNAIIAGATNSGKTTTMMAIPLYFPPETRIITIEDSPEMMLRRRSSYRNYHNIVALQTKDHENKEKRFDIARLTKVSLRMRPVKVMVGEVRDSQACRQAHESMNTGHNTYFTIHASSAANAAVRIVQLAGDGYNDEVIAAQLADTVDLILFQQKMGKSRIVTEVAELVGYEGARKPVCRSLFLFRQSGLGSDGSVKGDHVRTAGISESLAEKLGQALVDRAFIRRWQHAP